MDATTLTCRKRSTVFIHRTSCFCTRQLLEIDISTTVLNSATEDGDHHITLSLQARNIGRHTGGILDTILRFFIISQQSINIAPLALGQGSMDLTVVSPHSERLRYCRYPRACDKPQNCMYVAYGQDRTHSFLCAGAQMLSRSQHAQTNMLYAYSVSAGSFGS